MANSNHLVHIVTTGLHNAVWGRRIGKYMQDNLGGVQQASFTVNAQSGSNIDVNIQLKDEEGNDVAERCVVQLMVSADANGDAFNTTDYTIAGVTDGAVVEAVADKFLVGISEADGDLDVRLTNSGASTSYLHAIGPNGKIIGSSGAITHTTTTTTTTSAP